MRPFWFQTFGFFSIQSHLYAPILFFILKFSANKSDWVLDKFDVTVPMSTYLVAYTINDFEYRESPAADGDVVFKIWARRDAISQVIEIISMKWEHPNIITKCQHIQQVEYAKIIGPKVLKFFEKTFKVKYPLPKMDMIAIPDFSAGAMENWGKFRNMKIW